MYKVGLSGFNPPSPKFESLSAMMQTYPYHLLSGKLLRNMHFFWLLFSASFKWYKFKL